METCFTYRLHLESRTMMGVLEGKTAIISGGGTGVGAAMATISTRKG